MSEAVLKPDHMHLTPFLQDIFKLQAFKMQNVSVSVSLFPVRLSSLHSIPVLAHNNLS